MTSAAASASETEHATAASTAETPWDAHKNLTPDLNGRGFLFSQNAGVPPAQKPEAMSPRT